MKTRKYLVFGLFLVLSSVLVSAGSFIIKSNLVKGEMVITLDGGDVVLKDGELTTYGNSKIEVVPSSTSNMEIDTIPAKAGFTAGDCSYFEEQGVSHIGDYSCEDGGIVIRDEFIVKFR